MKIRWAEKLIGKYMDEVQNDNVDVLGLAHNPTMIVNKRDYETGVYVGLEWAQSILNRPSRYYVEEHYRLWGTYPKGVKL